MKMAITLQNTIIIARLGGAPRSLGFKHIISFDYSIGFILSL